MSGKIIIRKDFLGDFLFELYFSGNEGILYPSFKDVARGTLLLSSNEFLNIFLH
jgi:hypothetical protein